MTTTKRRENAKSDNTEVMPNTIKGASNGFGTDSKPDFKPGYFRCTLYIKEEEESRMRNKAIFIIFKKEK
ncbi:hypothetical protein CASFOL_008626 [Castilleja foliolosa]|uniref:Uncharacterized protein n=1 Tax=Castilleja foliolosa TaxID=1961234 RepID=A0ABD3DZS5_9LAMI